MGLMETLWGGQKPSDEGKEDATPFKLSLRFSPLRLSAMQNGRVDLVVGIENISGQAQLVSIDAMLPRQHLLGFDPTCVNKSCENKVGQLEPGQYKEVRVGIWGNNQTKAGEYPVELHAYSHYLDYNKVIHYTKKTVTLRVV